MPVQIGEYNENPRCRSNSRKIIKRIRSKRLKDGTVIPIEVTKTVIERDGSKNTTKTILSCGSSSTESLNSVKSFNRG